MSPRGLTLLRAVTPHCGPGPLLIPYNTIKVHAFTLSAHTVVFPFSEGQSKNHVEINNDGVVSHQGL